MKCTIRAENEVFDFHFSKFGNFESHLTDSIYHSQNLVDKKSRTYDEARLFKDKL